MKIEHKDAMHLIYGDSAAGTMRAAFHLARDQIIVSEDPLSCGPAPATPDITVWRKTREEFLKSVYLDWPDFSFSEFSDNGLLSNIPRVGKAENLYIWAAAGLRDQLTVAFVLALLSLTDKDLSKVFIVPVDLVLSGYKVRSLGELSVERLQALKTAPRKLELHEIRAYSEAWEAYTSSDPTALTRFLSAGHETPAILDAMRTLVDRYPSRESGLSLVDEQLIHWTNEKGRKASYILGHTIGFNDSLDTHGDQYVFHRLRRLGNKSLSSTLVELSGDLAVMRHCEAQITAFGTQVLHGHANALETNGIDDWIGGVHLTDRTHSPLRDGTELLLP